MPTEYEDDTPEWEVREDIPPALQKKWDKEESEGVRAGVCKGCGYTFTQEELHCVHCGASTGFGDGALISLKKWLFKNPLGIMAGMLIVTAVIVYLIRL